MKRCLFISFLFGVLFFTGVPCVDGASGTLDGALLKRASAITKTQFPEADSVILRENEFYTYETSGAYRSTDELYVKILTENGRVALRRFSLYFNTHYNRVAIQSIVVIKPDGRRIKVDVARNSRQVIDSSQMASNIYDPASRRLVVTIPHLEVGDVLYLKSSDEHFKPRIPDFWSNYCLLQSDSPILENNIEVNAPDTLPLRSIAVKDEVKGTVRFTQKKSSGRIIYKWSARNVPQVIPEPGMPEFHTCVQRLLVSTAGSWAEVSRWYWQLCRPRLEAVTPAMKKQVEALVRGKNTDMEKIKAIFQFVSQNIRYMGITPEKEAPGYEPHDVKLTFEQRYGVCRDKAALLVALLELAGFKAYPVLFMAGDPKDDEIPNGYFNHAVTAVELGKGNYVLMDPTYESTTELFPAFQADMSYLVAHPKGEKLRRSPVVSSQKNRVEIRTTARIDADAVLHGESTVKLYGVNDVYYRGALSRWTEERKKLFFTGRLQKVIPGAVLEELKILPENIRDMSRNIELRLRFSARLSTGAVYQQLIVPEFFNIFGIGEAVFQDVSLLARKYPLKLVSTCSADEVCTVKLPLTHRVMALPQAEHLQVGGKINVRRTASLADGVLKFSRRMDVNTLELTATEYPELKKVLNHLKNGSKVIPVTIQDYKLPSVADALKAFPGADSVIEKYDVSCDISDISRWSIRTRSRRKILNYAGIKAHSELKIPFVPGWLELGKIEAAVIAPDGKEHKVSPREINVMDSPRNGLAPRYPAGKIMVISLPRVVPGSTIKLDMTQHYLNRTVFSGQIRFSSPSAPVIAASLKVTAPSKMHLKSTVTGEAPCRYQEQHSETKSIRTWHFANLPRIPNEAGQPPWQLFCPGVLLSSGSNQIYARKLNDFLWEKVRTSLPAARKLIQEQKWDQIKERKEKLVKIRDHVDKFIRKTNVSLEDMPLSALSDAAVTLRSGYGNSADRAILLGAILKALDIKFQFVGASAVGAAPQTSRLYSYYPDPAKMNENILLKLSDEGWYLNDTGCYAEMGSTNSENKLGMDLTSGRLLKIQSASLKDTGRMLSFHIKCYADDSALIRVSESLFGGAYEQAKEVLVKATPERRRRFFEERVSALSHTGRLVELPLFNFDKYPGTLEYKIRASNFLSRTGGFRVMPLPRYDLLLRTGALPVAGPRTTPYWRNHAARLALRYTITPPPGFSAVPGRKEKVQEGKYGSAQFTETYSSMPGQISLYSRLYLPVELVDTIDFCELEKRKMRVSQPEADRIVFKQISGTAGNNAR